VIARLALLAGAVSLVLASVPARPAAAQMMPPVVSITTRPAAPENTCGNAPPSCNGAGWDANLGPHEFDIGKAGWVGAMDYEEMQFSLYWPSTWNLISWELCYGSILSGNPAQRGSPLHFDVGCAEVDRPFLRMIFDCTTPGGFGASNGRGLMCGSTNDWWDDPITQHVDIGDFCGMMADGPCEVCPHWYAGEFTPHQIDYTLPEGWVYADSLRVSGDRSGVCGGLPECGQEGYGYCLAGLEPDVPWLRTYVDWGQHDPYPFRLVIDTRGLDPGIYSGRVYANGGCAACARNCMPVSLRVLALADAANSDDARDARVLLGPPTPNPGETGDPIRFSIHAASPTSARVEVFDVAGRRVATVVDREIAAGTRSTSWKPIGATGEPLARGVYYLRLSAAGMTQSRMFILAR